MYYLYIEMKREKSAMATKEKKSWYDDCVANEQVEYLQKSKKKKKNAQFVLKNTNGKLKQKKKVLLNKNRFRKL